VSELIERLFERFGLFWCWMQLYSYGPVHTNTIPYMLRNCK
jgi:hypothetical protein